MAFNYDQVFQNMLAAATGSLKTSGPKAQEYVQTVMANHKDILKQLAQDRISGKMSEADMQSELSDQQEALKAELEGLEVIAEKAAQDAANAAIAVLTAAIKVALP